MPIIDSTLLRQKSSSLVLISHRGFSGVYPDNSLEGFEAAIKAGADLVETDIRMSLDGMLVCNHDPDKNGKNIHHTSSAELAALGVVTAEAVFASIKGRIGIMLDIKKQPTDVLPTLMDLIRKHGMEQQVVVGVRTLEQTRYMRQHHPDITLLGMMGKYRDLKEFYALGGHIGRLWERDICKESLDICKDRPFWITCQKNAKLSKLSKIFARKPGYTTPKKLAELAKTGADGIIVNDPALARKTIPAPLKKDHGLGGLAPF